MKDRKQKLMICVCLLIVILVAVAIFRVVTNPPEKELTPEGLFSRHYPLRILPESAVIENYEYRERENSKDVILLFKISFSEADLQYVLDNNYGLQHVSELDSYTKEEIIYDMYSADWWDVKKDEVLYASYGARTGDTFMRVFSCTLVVKDADDNYFLYLGKYY